MTDSMPGPVREALKLYLDQSPRRSLQDLITRCKENSFAVSIATLKRWSSRYKWQQHVAEHDRALAEEATAITYDQREQAIRVQLALVNVASKRYDDLIDPNNPNVTPAQRKRATNMRVSDYIKVIMIEERLLKQLEKMQRVRPVKRETTYTAEELDAMMRALIQVRHALPRT